MNVQNKKMASRFIEEIWNQQQFNRLDIFLHPNFSDHSLPLALPPDKEGLIRWITATGEAFEHETIIEEMVSEGHKIILKIKMLLKHVGNWRDIEPTGAAISTSGYRYLKFADGQIIEHWALIDGNSIENQLKEASHGCKIQA